MLEFFTDPFLRAPLLASMLMCFTVSLIGVIIVLRKRSLLAETLSHATYPGVTIALIFTALLGLEESFSFWILCGAFVAAFFGFKTVDYLEKKGRVKEDAALTFVLASFFGMGVFIASIVQSSFPQEWPKVHGYLYGQVATMGDFHILLYGILACATLLVLATFYKELKIFLFDQNYGFTTGVISKQMDLLSILLTLFAVVMGIRSVGIVLVSAMLIAPFVFARCLTDKLSLLFIIAGGSSALSAFLGNIASAYLSEKYGYSFAIGPLIVFFSAFFAFMALLFAPKRGICFRKRCSS